MDPAKLLNYRIPQTEQHLTRRDTILYALSVGVGADPLDRNELRFVYEQGLAALPTMSLVLAHPGFWLKEPDTGVDWVKVLHAGQTLAIHRPLPVGECTLVGHSRVTDIIDKGKDKGALLMWERSVYDKSSGDHYCTLTHATLCRGDGGFDGRQRPAQPPTVVPHTPPEVTCDLATLPRDALLYRLNGDYHPLHADPDVARAAGFERPILHGLCTLGVVGHAILKTCCNYEPSRLLSMEARFSGPVFPGDTIRTEIWRSGNGTLFRARVPARDAIVITNGRAEIDG